jgi:carbonic anhydrase
MRTPILKTSLSLAILTVLLFSCKEENKEENKENVSSNEITVSAPVENHIFTAEEQAKLTPEEVLADFKAGNKRFRNNA